MHSLFAPTLFDEQNTLCLSEEGTRRAFHKAVSVANITRLQFN